MGTKRNETKSNASEGFTAEERAAMKERARELKASGKRADGEAAVVAKIAEMPDADRVIAEKVHAVVTANAPTLWPKTWYGMPAYYKDEKVLCFFQSSDKFKARYATIGFDESAMLDESTMWPTAYAITKWTPENEASFVALLKKAMG